MEFSLLAHARRILFFLHFQYFHLPPLLSTCTGIRIFFRHVQLLWTRV